jgi:hypothetical protein
MTAMRCPPAVAGVLVALCCLPLLGCPVVAVAAVGAATYGVISWHGNEAQMDFQAELPKVWDASKTALRALAFPVDDTQQHTVTEGTLTAGEAKLIVERQPGNVTRVRARVGTFDTDDNKRRAQLILEEIQKRL